LLFGVLHSQSKGEEADAVNRVMFISLALPIFELKMVLAVADRKRRGTIVGHFSACIWRLVRDVRTTADGLDLSHAPSRSRP